MGWVTWNTYFCNVFKMKFQLTCLAGRSFIRNLVNLVVYLEPQIKFTTKMS